MEDDATIEGEDRASGEGEKSLKSGDRGECAFLSLPACEDRANALEGALSATHLRRYLVDGGLT